MSDQPFVTRPEMAAHLAPMRADIAEIKGDVKLLLSRDAGSRAVSTLVRRSGTVITTLAAGAIGSAITLFIH